MSDTAWYVVTALASLSALGAGIALGRRRRRGVAAWFVALALLLFKAVLNHHPAWEFALFPWPAYIYLQGYLLYPLALLCLGLAVSLLPAGRSRAAVAVLAGFTLLVSLWTERWMLVQPDDSSRQRADRDHHCIQTKPWSCGPAACVSVLSHLGVPATEGEMMRLCRTPSYGGTSLFRIQRGLRLKLPRDSFEVRIRDAPDGLAVVQDGKLHVVAVRFARGLAIVHDPLQPGPERIPRSAFRARYRGPAVVVTPVRE